MGRVRVRHSWGEAASAPRLGFGTLMLISARVHGVGLTISKGPLPTRIMIVQFVFVK